MKRILAGLIGILTASGSFGQGTVNFLNSASTLINVDRTWIGGTIDPTAATAGQYFFGLFIAPVGTTDVKSFEFTGLYATNQAAAGRFTGGANLAVPGWAPGATKAFLIRGWSADLGHDWSVVSPLFLDGPFSGTFSTNSFIGTTPIAPNGIAGGPLPAPAFNLFGGPYGLQAGFNLPYIPEPTYFALAGLGAFLMACIRRRERPV